MTEDEHATILDEVLGGDRDVAARAAESVRLVAATTRAIDLLVGEGAAHDVLLIDLLRRRRADLVDRLVGLLDLGDEQAAQAARRGLRSDDPDERRRALERIRRRVRPATAERLGRIERDLAAAGALPTTAIDALRSCVASAEPYVRAAALQALAERGLADAETLDRLTGDELGLVDEVVDAVRSRAEVSEDGVSGEGQLTTIEKMRHLQSIPLFASLEPTGLAELARASIEAAYADGESLGRAGEPGHEAFVLLTGEVRVRRATDGQESVVEVERPGEVFGELAVIDPAPRAATMVAGPEGARVLCLDGATFRRVLHADPAVAAGVLRTLARRLRAGQPGAAGPSGG